MTSLQQAAYDAQFAAALPVSELARTTLLKHDELIRYRSCAAYLHAVQSADWFRAAFTSHAEPVAVMGGRGVSQADAVSRWVRIGSEDRREVGRCEQACLHELAHIVTGDYDAGRRRREPLDGTGTRGHHHAWRVNFVFIVRQTLGKPAAVRLRREFAEWGLPTRR